MSQERKDWFSLLPAYVDGELDEKAALALVLAAERDPALQSALEAHRNLFSALDQMECAEPPADFDQRILASIPYERYASAPRRHLPQLKLAEAPGLVGEAITALGRGGQLLAIFITALSVGGIKIFGGSAPQIFAVLGVNAILFLVAGFQLRASRNSDRSRGNI